MIQSQTTSKSVYINNKDPGFWTQEPITIQRFDETSECCAAEVRLGFCMDCKEHAEERHELVWCNHAGAVEETIQNQWNNPHGMDVVWDTRIMVCDKENCGAFKREGENYWEDAPFEGVYEE